MPKFLDVTDTAAAKAAIHADYCINVKDYAGIDLTGATPSDDAFQTILTAAAGGAAAGAGPVEVYIPPGVLSLTTRPVVDTGVTVRGAGRGATRITSSHVDGVLQISGDTDITIADMTLEATASGDSANTYGIRFASGDLQQRITVTGCTITGTTNSACRVYDVHQFTFTDNNVEGCDYGLVMMSPTEDSGNISTQIVISHNRFRDVGAVNIQLYGPGPGSVNSPTFSGFNGVEISGNDLRDFAQTGPDGPIPLEPSGITNCVITNNTIDGAATRGISTANNVNMVISGNVIRNQSIYAVELNGGRQISLTGNTVENCATFTMETGYGGGGIRLSDVVIADNVYVGSGLSSPESVSSIRLVTARRVRITGNVFTDWQHISGAMRIGFGLTPPPEDCVVEGNTFVVSDADTSVSVISVSSAIRTNVVRNTIRINRDLVSGEDYEQVISAQMAAAVDTLIEGNHLMFTGTVTDAPHACGIGNNFAGADVCPGLTVRRNHITNGPHGLYLRTSSTDLTVYDNTTSTCVAADVIPSTAAVVGAGAGQVADLSIVAFGKDTTRAAGYGDFPFGIKLQRAVTFTKVTFRGVSADASGNLVVELRKNGSQVSGSPATIAAANQTAGTHSSCSTTGTWAFAAGDVISVYVTGVGTTPGKGLIADIKGVTA